MTQKQSEIELKLAVNSILYDVTNSDDLVNQASPLLLALIDTACVEAVQVALANSATPNAGGKQVDKPSAEQQIASEFEHILEVFDANEMLKDYLRGRIKQLDSASKWQRPKKLMIDQVSDEFYQQLSTDRPEFK